MKPSISVAAVVERDIDLLLLEEFIANSMFRQWFLGQVKHVRKSASCSLVEAKRSVTESLGESDLDITLRLSRNKVRLLIENKIGASFMGRQAKRYCERKRGYLRRGECHECITVLVAPEKYLGDINPYRGFDHSLSYEKILNWFQNQINLGDRCNFKINLLNGAISKAKHGYQPEADRPVTEFWQAYWRLLLKRAPGLEMERPERKPAKAGFVYLFPDSLPANENKYYSIVHKFPHGNVDLEFCDLGRKIIKVYRIVNKVLPKGATVEKANKSAALRLKVPVVNTCMSFSAQKAKALKGILAARRWLSWAIKHPRIISRLIKLAG